LLSRFCIYGTYFKDANIVQDAQYQKIYVGNTNKKDVEKKTTKIQKNLTAQSHNVYFF